jgi:DNA-binding MarR family transcriptional regulator
VSIAATLYDRLERVANLLGSQARATARIHALEPIQLEVLHYLYRCNRFSDTSKAVASFFSLTKGTVSQTVSALHRKGMIEKVSDEADGRLIHLHLTRAGERVVKEAFPPVLLLAASTDDDEGLLAHLDELLVRMQTATGSVSFGECQTCGHFIQESERRFRCGLMGESLRRSEIVKICLEHVRPDD